MTQEEIDLQIATLRVAYDPDSPFHGLVDVKSELMAMPLEDQHQLFAALPEDLKAQMFQEEDS